MIVLFIDDEERRMRPVVEEFDEAGHKIHFIKSVDEALTIIRDPNQKFDLIVMDISMPSGEELGRQETDGGARSGIVLYNILRQARRTQKVAVYTNFGSSVESKFSSEVPRYFRFVRKPDVLPFEFVERMVTFVAE